VRHLRVQHACRGCRGGVPPLSLNPTARRCARRLEAPKPGPDSGPCSRVSHCSTAARHETRLKHASVMVDALCSGARGKSAPNKPSTLNFEPFTLKPSGVLGVLRGVRGRERDLLPHPLGELRPSHLRHARHPGIFRCISPYISAYVSVYFFVFLMRSSTGRFVVRRPSIFRRISHF